MWYGKGAFSYPDCMNMTPTLRRKFIKKCSEYLKAEAEALNSKTKSGQQTLSMNDMITKIPEHLKKDTPPDFVTKASSPRPSK